MPVVRFHVSKLQRKGLKCSLKIKGKMLQPAEEAPPPAPIPLPTEEDETAAREAHPEAAAALQRAEDALAWAKQTDDDEQIALARLAFLRHAPPRAQLAALVELLSRAEEEDHNGQAAQLLRALRDKVLRKVQQKEEFLVRRAATRAELEERRRELHVFLLATAAPKQGEAAFVLRNAARALRKIGEFIVGPFGSAQREEAARFAEVSHLFVAPARLDEIR